jgi:glycosyltransferase involved in cell wall biosynthesis
MKILIVNSYDFVGGAARAAYRLHKSLLAFGVESQMLVLFKTTDDYSIISETKPFKKFLIKLSSFADNLPLKKYKPDTIFSCNRFSIANTVAKINSLKPDLVHLHWINHGMINISEFSSIHAPLLWTLHDNWAFTGGCHIMWECTNYKDRCGNCPRLASQKDSDLRRKNWNIKNQSYSRIPNLCIISPSRWLWNCAKESSLLKSFKHVHLPNVIDTNQFKPIDKQTARNILNLPQDPKIVLFGAMSSTKDINKGFDLLSEALNKLKTNNLEFVVFGGSENPDTPPFKYPVHYLGRLYDDVTLQLVYSAADVMVVPSRQENLSYAIMESLSCGTPVVAFDIGGNSDLIDHLENGFLAKSFDTTDLANGIEWVLTNDQYSEISHNARQKILTQFDGSVLTPEFVKLYEEMLSN